LSGIAFALFYSVLAFQSHRWADRGNRVTIISIMIAVERSLALCECRQLFATAVDSRRRSGREAAAFPLPIL